MIEKVFKKLSLKDSADSDAEYWAFKTPLERLRAGTFLLEEYLKAHHISPRIQKVRSQRNLHDDLADIEELEKIQKKRSEKK